jgi:hypothetical protein
VREVRLPALVKGGLAASAEISLRAPAGTGGVTLSLASSCAAGTVPATLSIPQGITYVAVKLQTTAVTVTTPCTITATGPHNAIVSNVISVTP